MMPSVTHFSGNRRSRDHGHVCAQRPVVRSPLRRSAAVDIRLIAKLAEKISAEVDRIVAASSRRADLEATLASAGIVCLVDGPEEAMAVANAIAPEHLQLMVAGRDAQRLLEPDRCGQRERPASG